MQIHRHAKQMDTRTLNADTVFFAEQQRSGALIGKRERSTDNSERDHCVASQTSLIAAVCD